jgi:hypothetical protein
VNDLLALIHKACAPGMVEQSRKLPYLASTLKRHASKRFQSLRNTPARDCVEDADCRDTNVVHADEIVIDEITAGEGDVTESFVHFDVLSVIADMVNAENAWEGDIRMDFVRKSFSDDQRAERQFDEIVTADWFKHSEEHVRRVHGDSKKVLSVILYIDGVTVDFFGNISLMPIMLTIGNFHEAYRQTKLGKRLLGFIPSISKTSDEHRFPSARLNRELIHAALER